MKKNIPEAVVRRLPGYYRYLSSLLQQDVGRISSQELSERMGLTASQIRQDINSFGGEGQQGYGYNTQELHDKLGEMLGLNKPFSLALVGAGNMGQALMRYERFADLGFNIRVAFDVSPSVVGTRIGEVDVYPVSELAAYLRCNKVDIAILAVPEAAAQPTADLLVKNGVTAIWNFAPVDLQVPKGVSTVNVHLLDSLLMLLYRMHAPNE